MSNDRPITKHECRSDRPAALVILSFDIPSSFVITHSSFSIHLPVFNKFRRYFLEETRWPLENIAIPAAQAHLRVGKIKLVAGARDGHVKQTPFFLECVARVERAAAGKHPVRQPDDKNTVKLEAFCLVDGGKI